MILRPFLARVGAAALGLGLFLAGVSACSSSSSDAATAGAPLLCPCPAEGGGSPTSAGDALDAAFDAGFMSFPDPSKPACESLSMCCYGADPDFTKCVQTITGGDQAACSTLMTELEAKHHCPSTLGRPYDASAAGAGRGGGSGAGSGMCACPSSGGGGGGGSSSGGPVTGGGSSGSGSSGGPASGGGGDAGAAVSAECHAYAVKWVDCYNSASGGAKDPYGDDVKGAEQSCSQLEQSCAALVACFNAAPDCNRGDQCSLSDLCHR